MPSRSKKTEAWKKLCRVARNGPRKVILRNPRLTKDADPLEVAELTRKVQIRISGGYCKGNLVIVLFKKSFAKIGLRQGKTYSMTRNNLTRAAKVFQSVLRSATHNHFVMNRTIEKRFTKTGRCYIMFNKEIENPDAVINICANHNDPLHKKIPQHVKDKVQALFENC